MNKIGNSAFMVMISVKKKLPNIDFNLQGVPKTPENALYVVQESKLIIVQEGTHARKRVLWVI